MLISIKGLTGSTIILNSLKTTLRGETTLSNINIDNDEQMREIIGLKNAGFLVYRTETSKAQVEQEDVRINFERESQRPAMKPTKPVQRPIQKAPPPEEEQEPEEDDGTEADEAEAEETFDQAIDRQTVKKVVAKRVASASAEDNDEVTIMTLNGPVTGKMVRSTVKDMPETEATRASIEAMKKLEDEENGEEEQETEVDESALPANERMGLPATIGAGKNSIQVNMKNSILPESDIAAKAKAKGKNIKFINPVDDSPNNDPFIDKDTKGKQTASAFIDNENADNEEANDNDGDDDNGGEKTGEY